LEPGTWNLELAPRPMTKSKRISYVIMLVLLVLIGVFSLGTLVLTSSFGYFALQQLTFGGRSKLLAVSLYLVAVAAIICGMFYFGKQTAIALPKIAEKTIPAVA